MFLYTGSEDTCPSRLFTGMPQSEITLGVWLLPKGRQPGTYQPYIKMPTKHHWGEAASWKVASLSLDLLWFKANAGANVNYARN